MQNDTRTGDGTPKSDWSWLPEDWNLRRVEDYISDPVALAICEHGHAMAESIIRRDGEFQQWREAEKHIMVALLDFYSQMGTRDLEGAVAQIVVDLVGLAKTTDWQPQRKAISGRLRTTIYRRDGYACVECSQDDVTQLTIDHRIPVALGGENEPDNLRTLCKRCNSSKGAQL